MNSLPQTTVQKNLQRFGEKRILKIVQVNGRENVYLKFGNSETEEFLGVVE